MASSIHSRGEKPAVDQISDEGVPHNEPGHGASYGKFQVPPLVAAMSPDERVAAENSLRKKIDLRLMPMVILMYVMNYLDRNNIAAVRLAGLQDELNLSSHEYQVRIPKSDQVPWSEYISARPLSVFSSSDTFLCRVGFLP